jgi:hypothetical protein
MILSWLIAAFLTPAFAALEEPFELMVLTPIEPTQFEAGLCPGNPLTEPPKDIATRPIVATPDVTKLIQQDQLQILAQNAADVIYSLPDLESVASGAELVTKTPQFLSSLPEGYQFYSFFSEPEAGMKYMLLKPIDDDSNKPYVLSIAGTQSLLDWIADLDLGRAQLLKLNRLLKMFTTCQFLDSKGVPLAARGLIVTGHSLGGGLAQAIAYRIQKARLDKNLTAMQIDLITFNGFGGRTLIEKDEKYNEDVERLIRARNYFVDGDLVSRIGVHVGPTYSLGQPSVSGPFQGNAVTYHLMSTVRSLGETIDLLLSGFMRAEERPPSASEVLGNLTSMGSIARALPDYIYRHRESRVVELLNEAILTLERTDLKDPVNRETARYISRLVFAREMSLRDRSPAPVEHIRELKTLRQRLYRAVP